MIGQRTKKAYRPHGRVCRDVRIERFSRETGYSLAGADMVDSAYTLRHRNRRDYRVARMEAKREMVKGDECE
jgi:hypothetical protein